MGLWCSGWMGRGETWPWPSGKQSRDHKGIQDLRDEVMQSSVSFSTYFLSSFLPAKLSHISLPRASPCRLLFSLGPMINSLLKVSGGIA